MAKYIDLLKEKNFDFESGVIIFEDGYKRRFIVDKNHPILHKEFSTAPKIYCKDKNALYVTGKNHCDIWLNKIVLDIYEYLKLENEYDWKYELPTNYEMI